MDEDFEEDFFIDDIETEDESLDSLFFSKMNQDEMLSKLLARAKEMDEAKKKEKAEKHRLIDLEVDYDETTLKIFDDFVNDFMTLYPNILSREEIYKRLKANIKHNIMFRNLDHEINKKDTSLCGFFKPTEHYVCITNNPKYSEEEIRAVTFHELCHALVENNPYDELNHEEYEKSNFISESIVTLMEEDYYEKILHKHKERVNSYIPIYARSLRCIFGEELLREFITKYKRIDDLITKVTGENDQYDTSMDLSGIAYSEIAYSLINRIDDIYFYLRESHGDINVSYENSNLELNFTKLLEQYLQFNSDISDEEKMHKIESLIKAQISPNFSEFKSIIEKTINNKEGLSKHPLLKFVYEADSLNYNELLKEVMYNLDIDSKELSRLIKKYDEYSAREFFDINGYTYNERYSLYHYDKDKTIKYNSNNNLYGSLFSLFSKGVLDDNNLDIVNIYSSYSDEYDSEIAKRIATGNSKNLTIELLRDIFGINKSVKIYKVETNNGDYYLDEDSGFIDYYTKTSIDEYAINIEKSCKNKDITLTMARYILKYINELKSKGVDEIYSSIDSIVYSMNGKEYRITFVDSEMGEEIYHLEDEFTLNKIDCLKPDIKQIQKKHKI